MGQTMIEKILSHHAGRGVSAGDIVTVRADRLMLDDIMLPFISSKLEEMGFETLSDPFRVVLICDHLVPASREEDVRVYKACAAFAERYGIKNFHRSDGVCHQLMAEAGYVAPGDIVFGTDSHTTSCGCIGAFSTGIGYTEMAAALGSGELWVRVPSTIRVRIEGEPQGDVMSKDMILRIIGDLTAAGAAYRALEFSGGAVRGMSVASRMTMANMAVEAGAKCALFSPDDKAEELCRSALNSFQRQLSGDEDAAYERTMDYRAEDFVPMAALPPNVDRVCPVSEAGGLPIDQVFLGSCTNGRAEDLAAAAEILRGKKVHPFVRLIVTPASRRVWMEAEKNGALSALSRAGAIITHPSCGLCCGRSGGILADGERIVSTSNRNFLGRMGSAGAQIYLASPKTAAMCALTGQLGSS